MQTIATGTLVGYARVSTRDQGLEQQLALLNEAGCTQVFADLRPGRGAARPELAAAFESLRPGDTLVIASLDRLSRSMPELVTTVAGLRERGVGLRSLAEGLDTTTDGGMMIFDVFSALAEFNRELTVEHTREGLEAAKAAGRGGGRPPVMTPEKIAAARALMPEHNLSAIARMIGVSRGTLYAHMDAILTAEPVPEA